MLRRLGAPPAQVDRARALAAEPAAPRAPEAPSPVEPTATLGLSRPVAPAVAHPSVLAGLLPRATSAAVLALSVGLIGCAGMPLTLDRVPQGVVGTGVAIDEPMEAALTERNRPGHLIEVHRGPPGATTRLAADRIHAAPAHLQAVVDRGVRDDQSVLTFAYDDRFRRLTDSATDLARQLVRWLEYHPGAPLEVDAHSMGSRVVLAALDELAREGKLDGRSIHLHLIAPPLGGYAAANAARWSPAFIRDLIDGVRPGMDMGTTSSFQDRLETLTLPPHVRTTLWVGERDEIVDPALSGFVRVRDRLGAEVRRVPGATHDSIIDAFARRD